MRELLVEDKLWNVTELFLPIPESRRFRYPGRKPLDIRESLLGDCAFDRQQLREALWERGILSVSAKRDEEHGDGHRIYRWVVERTASMHEMAFVLAARIVCSCALYAH